MIKHELSMMSSDKIHFNITRGDEPPDVVVVLFVVVVVLFVVVGVLVEGFWILLNFVGFC